MKKSDKIESKIKVRQGEPTLWEIWKEVCISKTLIKHVIDNELRHIWRIILLILSAMIGVAGAFILKNLGLF